MNNQEKLQTVLIFLFVLVLLFVAVSLSAQKAYVYSISKDGLTTEKQIRVDIKSDNEIHFWTSKKNVEIFVRIGKGFDGADIWRDMSNKDIKCVVKDNLRIFAVTEKKAFYYVIPNKKIQQ